jgi:glycosyltransferase involved in cell wall biosynthesis
MDHKEEKIQVLVATMHQCDFSKVEEMKIATDVLFANQADRNEIEIKYDDAFEARMVTTPGRGVGCNRNLALAHATGHNLVLADEDVVYRQGYAQMITNAFRVHPDADAIVFNIDTIGASIPSRKNHESKRVRIYNALNYGAVRVAVRRKSLLRARISFSGFFGGGAMYSSGEDTLFICDMLRRGFKIYTSGDTIAVVDQRESTWFRGYNEKYLYDKGALNRAVFPAFPRLFCLMYLIRHPEVCREAGLSLTQAMGLMCRGIKGYSEGRPWSEGGNAV